MKNKITYICSAIIFSIMSFVALNAASADTPLYQIQGEKIIYTNNNSVVIADGNDNAKNKPAPKDKVKSENENRSESKESEIATQCSEGNENSAECKAN